MRNGYKEYNKMMHQILPREGQKYEDSQFEENQVIIQIDDEDPRLKMFDGRKRLFQGGLPASKYVFQSI